MVATALVDEVECDDLVDELAAEIVEKLGGRSVDVCLLFASPDFADDLADIGPLIHERLGPRAFVGGSGEAVICDKFEYEEQPAIALWAAHLPRARAAAFHVSQDDLERLEEPAAWHEHLGVGRDDAPCFVLLADPFTLDVLALLDRLGEAYPQRPAIGGISSASEPGQNVLIFEGQALRHGACGVALWGEIVLDTVVSQGCRPIGRHLIVTDGEANVIRALGGKPALTMIVETLRECSQRDIHLLRSGGLLIGRAVDERRPGDFVIRNPIGFDDSSGAMMINDLVRPGQTVQFHVRDRVWAAEGLVSSLGARPRRSAAGALLFTCNGRGRELFRRPHHDARAVARACGARPLAGLFCAGEIAPVGGRNFIHGYSASVGFFCPSDPG